MGYRVLLVDDEPLIRKGIKAKIDWKKYFIDEVAEADNGAEAIKIFDSDKYDIVITDIKMPEMDGITLIKELRDKRPECKFAIISGYAEFEYAKKAISLGVEDYILKPVEPSELEIVISRIIAAIEDDIKGNKDNINMFADNEQLRTEETDKNLCSVIFERVCDNSSGSKIPESLLTPKFLIVSVLKLKRKGSNSLNILEDNTLQIYSIREGIKNSIPQDVDVTFFRNYKVSDEFIFIFGFHERNDTIELPRFVMTSVINELKSFDEIVCAAGLGEIVEGLDGLWQSYYQAYYAVCEKMLKGYGKIFSFRDIREKSARINLPEEKRRILLVYMQEGNQLEVNNYIDQILNDALKVDNISYNSIRNICEDIYMCVKDFINKKSCNSDIILGEKFDFSNEILQFDNIEQVRGWIKRVIEFALLNTAKNSILSGEDIVKEVMQYIRQNYNQDITLSYISDKYHINQNYFCRLFKDVAGNSFNKFLTNIRIEKACEMIENSSLKISKIAELIGYSDPKYFSKVFKSETGVSPSEYLSGYRLK